MAQQGVPLSHPGGNILHTNTPRWPIFRFQGGLVGSWLRAIHLTAPKVPRFWGAATSKATTHAFVLVPPRRACSAQP